MKTHEPSKAITLGWLTERGLVWDLMSYCFAKAEAGTKINRNSHLIC